MRIAVDAMGGDKAPFVVVEGAVLAQKEYGYDIALVGNREAVNKELAKYDFKKGGIEVVNASEVIEMDEPPAISVRKKKDSSISVAINLVSEKKADAMISAGNTGAVVCAATFVLGLLPGIERPGIAIIYPTPKNTAMLIDVGANINPKPVHLLQYGIMADAYSRDILYKPNPRIGLLSVGEEETKGTEFIKETHKLLNESKINFIGNVEGRDIFSGDCDCILCDGFVGNVVLKVAEALAGTIGGLIKKELSKSLLAKAGALLNKSAYTVLKKELDYTEYGGAPLLGVDGCCIISHGASNAKAIKNAIRVAGEFVKQNVNKHILEAVKGYK